MASNEPLFGFNTTQKKTLIDYVEDIAAQVDVSDKPQIAALATLATPNATDLPTVITLANDLKARLNQVITALKA